MLAHFNQREGSRLLSAEETSKGPKEFFLKSTPASPLRPLPLLSTSLQKVFQHNLGEGVLFYMLLLLFKVCFIEIQNLGSHRGL